MKNFGNGNRRGSQSDRRFDHRGSGRSQMHDAICDQCGESCKVPFVPTSGKPIYCSDCFEKRGNGRDSDRRSNFSERRDHSSTVNQIDYSQQLSMITNKLDQIIELLANQENLADTVEE